MRQAQNTKRPRGRSNNTRRNVPARHQTFDSNGPSVRIRGSAFQVHEKYLAMARDASSAGDRVSAENFLQHAEHYFRIINVDKDDAAKGRGQPNGAGGGDNPQQVNGQDGARQPEQQADAAGEGKANSAGETANPDAGPDAEMEQPEATVTSTAPKQVPVEESPETDEQSD